jgi:hypothetical protein
LLTFWVRFEFELIFLMQTMQTLRRLSWWFLA